MPSPAALPSVSWRWTLAVFAAVFAGHFHAARDLSPGWDEGYTWERLELLGEWLRGAPANPGRALREAAGFRGERPAPGWWFSKEEPDGHGPAYALLSGLGHAATAWALAPPLSYRVGSVALFACAAACLFRTLAPRWGQALAALAPLTLAAQPRLLPELAFGIVDGPLTSFACLAWCGFVSAGKPWRGGLALGAAMATKLTGWFLLPALFLAALLDGKAGLKRWAWTALFAFATMFAMNVGWWTQPIQGPVRFFKSNLTRDQTIPIGNLYCGTLYPFSLPWHNTLVWTAVAVPPLVVLLGIAGAGLGAAGWWRACRLGFAHQERDGTNLVGGAHHKATNLVGGGIASGQDGLPPTPTLPPKRGEGELAAGLLACWLTFMALRALPQAPGHDGTRQLALAFLFLVLLAGAAAAALERWRRGWGVAALGLAFASSLFDCVRHHPLQLSYYSPAVGGLPGVVGKFEPTYFWDACTPDVREFLNRNTPPGRSVLFATNPRNWEYLHRWKLLVPPPHGPGLRDAAVHWYVMQHRPSQLMPRDRWLLAHATPAYERKLHGVSLVAVYSEADLRKATAAGKEAPR